MLYSSVHKQAKSSYHSSHMRQNVHVPNLLDLFTCVKTDYDSKGKKTQTRA